jgi:hypothetical protein
MIGYDANSVLMQRRIDVICPVCGRTWATYETTHNGFIERDEAECPVCGVAAEEDMGQFVMFDFECEACPLFGTGDCTKENCSLVHQGEEPLRMSEDDWREE